jgi:LPS export ABC transporter permease LptG
VGTWAANLGFLILGLVLLWRAERVGGGPAGAIRLPFAPGIGSLVRRIPDRIAGLRPRAAQHAKWVRILDLYVIRGFLFYFLLVSVAFAALVVVITLFELLPDIAEHDAGVGLVSVYFAYYLPQVVYLITPLAILVAVFITLGSLTRSNETMAARAGAISLYRLSWPLLGVAILFSAGVYLMGDYLLPYTNQRQDAYRDAIKGRAPQTYLDPLRKWMVGSRNQIYFYNYFDPEQNSFADLSVFDFDQNQSLVSWTFASRVTPEGDGWRFQNGWARSLEPGLPPGYRAFADERFGALVDPPDYFKREIRLASQMNYPELADHIEELRRAGFEVGRLTVELYRKLSYPLVSVIMAMIAIPFALSTGRRGAFFGIGIAIVIGITYWAAFELLEKLGGMGQISPPIAAWFPNLIFGFGGIWMLLKVRT